MDTTLPPFLKSIFWSYKFEELDREKDKNLIIFNILNYGGLKDWKWLVANYSEDEIRQAIKKSTATAWFKQSLSLWQNIFKVKARPWRFAYIPRPADWPWAN
jgi:hypothetical protein